MEAVARREGLRFAGAGLQDYPAGALAQSVSTLGKLSGRASLKYSVECACKISRLILRDGPDLIRRQNIDALLVDQNEPSGGSVAEHLRIPFVSVCTSLPLNREPMIPPPFVGWSFSSSPLARARNRIGYAIADRLIAPIQAELNNHRSKWGLGRVARPDDTFSPYCSIAQIPREFDFPHERLSGTFHYLGPWFDEQTSAHIAFPFEKLDGRPLVYGSIGTLQSSNSAYFQIMAEACARMEVQLVISLGHRDAKATRDFPGNPLVVSYAPQIELLARAAVSITHAGMNTTLQSLHFGVPAVAIPLAHDQPAIAARLSRAGAGIVIPPSRLTASNLRNALRALLPDASEFRVSAHRLRDAIRKSGGVKRAAQLAEQIVTPAVML
jgi:MGT family glycosyltransferase